MSRTSGRGNAGSIDPTILSQALFSEAPGAQVQESKVMEEFAMKRKESLEVAKDIIDLLFHNIGYL